MDIKKELIEMLGYSTKGTLTTAFRGFKIDHVKLYDVLVSNTSLIVKRDYIYSIVNEATADEWWTYYVDNYYFKKEEEQC